MSCFSNTETFIIEKITLISLPNGQLCDVFNNSDILSAGKSKDGESAKNVRFHVKKLVEIEPWRVKTLYKRITNDDEPTN